MLKAAAKAVTQLRHFDLNDFENNDTVQQFEKVESVIKESFTSFGVRFVFSMSTVSIGIEFMSRSYLRNGQRGRTFEGKRGKRIKVVWTN